MDVGSTINLYGYMFGWHVYDMMFNFVKATGLWLIPFFVMFFKIYMNAGFGESDGYNPYNALVAMEKYVFSAIIVYLVFFVPTIPVNKSSIIYTNGAITQTVGNTGTTYDVYKDVVKDRVKIPAGWYIVLLTTSSLNQLFKTLLPDGTQIRDIMYDFQQTKLDDPKLQAELNSFSEHCKTPAQARLNIIRSQYPKSPIAQKIDEYRKDVQNDINNGWIEWTRNKLGGGTSHWKIDERYPANMYYQKWLWDDSLLCKTGQDPNATLCIPKTSTPLTPQNGGYTSCLQWWKGSFMKKGLSTSLKDAFKIPYTIDTNEFNARISAKLRGQDGSLRKDGSRGLGDKKGNWWQWGEETTAGIFVTMANWVNSVTNTVVRFALPIAQGLAMMLIFMLLVIFILLGGYSLPSMAGLAILLFGISSLTIVWNIIAWVDNLLLSVMYGGPKGVFELIGDSFSLETAVWNLVIFAAYGGVTLFWLRFIVELGATGARAVGDMISKVDGMGDNISKGNSLRKGAQKTYEEYKNK